MKLENSGSRLNAACGFPKLLNLLVPCWMIWGLASPLDGAEAQVKPAAGDLQKSFEKPEAQCRPKTRWWWEKPLDHAELFRQLDLMHEQGMGGVEIVPWKAPDYGSKECMDAIVAIIERAAKLGMTVHLTPTQSWPWTLPDGVDPKVAASHVMVYGRSEILSGPTTWSGPAPLPTVAPDILKRMQVSEPELAPMRRLVAVTLVPTDDTGDFASPRMEGGRELQPITKTGTGGPKAEAATVLPCSADLKDIAIPAGRWTVMAWWSQPVGKSGRRWILNLWDKPALDAFYGVAVQSLLDRLPPALVGTTLVDVYSDNPELWQQTWSDGFLERFRQLHGYDLIPWMHCGYAIDAGGDKKKALSVAQRVQHDIEENLAALMREGYQIASDWLRARKLRLRAETYGPAYGDPEDNYASVDIPEMESLGSYLELTYNQKGTSSAVSAARLFGKAMVSCETYTFLSEGFISKAKPNREQHATLAMLRKAGDDLLAMGVQEFIFHGYPSRPQTGDTKLESTFYAHSWINHTNPFYPFMHGHTERMARLTQLMRAGEPVVELAFVTDGVTQHLRENLRLDPGFENRFQLDIHTGQNLRRAVSSGICTVADGRIRTPGVSYRALLVDAGCARGDTLDTVRQLAESGATVFVLESGAVLEHAGLHQPKEHDDKARAALKALTATGGKGKVLPVAKLSDWKSVAGQTGFTVFLEGPSGWDGTYPANTGKRNWSNTYWQHRRGADWDLFFIHNNSMKDDRSGEWTFRVEGEPELWDATTGEVKGLPFASDGKVAKVTLDLPADGTAVVVFRRDGKAAKYKPGKIASEKPLAGPWKMTFRHVNNSAPLEQTVEIGQNWRTTPGLETFAGTATASVEIGELKLRDGQRCYLDFGKVHEVVSVSSAGKELGVAWEPPYRIEITGAVKSGAKSVEIKAANILAAAFDHYKNDPLPGGIFGPVKLLVLEP